MTFSKGNTEFEKIISLSDILEVEPDEEPLWYKLHKSGIKMKKEVVNVYVVQKTCIYCGGQIIEVQGLDKDNWELRCYDCKYLFKESDYKI